MPYLPSHDNDVIEITTLSLGQSVDHMKVPHDPPSAGDKTSYQLPCEKNIYKPKMTQSFLTDI